MPAPLHRILCLFIDNLNKNAILALESGCFFPICNTLSKNILGMLPFYLKLFGPAGQAGQSRRDP